MFMSTATYSFRHSREQWGMRQREGKVLRAIENSYKKVQKLEDCRDRDMTKNAYSGAVQIKLFTFINNFCVADI